MRDRAIRVAGALAESGIARLEVTSGQAVSALLAGTIDLPGFLLSAAPGTQMRTPDGALLIQVTAEGMAWACAESGAAARFADALARSADQGARP